MIVLLAVIIGAGLGAYTARSREGSGLDIAQYAAGYGIAFGIAGLFVSLILSGAG